MKRQLLGKYIVLLLLPLALFGSVKESVEKSVLYRGDSVTYTIAVSGKDVEFPTITEIGGYPILSTAGAQNIRVVNGDFQKSVSKSYIFTPKESLEIPSFKVLVNGGVELTKAITVKVVEPSQDKGAPIVLDIRLSKERAHVGELVRCDLIFKQKPNVPIYKLDIEEPKFEDFWVKKMSDSVDGVEGEYVTKTYSYLLFAQKSGKLTIPSLTANVGQLAQQQRRRGIDPFFNSAFGQKIRYTKVFSNALTLDVEALPNRLELYGDFNINAKVDKTVVAANKPLNLTISIEGIGNIDDVKKYSLDLEDAVIYANEPVIKARVVGEDYLGSFEQKIVIIADGSYTIPALELHYFDRESQKEVVKKSEPIVITVTGGIAKVSTIENASNSKIELSEAIKGKPLSGQTTSSYDWMQLLYAALVGFGVGGLFVWLMMRSRSEYKPKEKRAIPIEEQIKKSKSDKALFELLLPYKKESVLIDTVLVQLEENIYRGADNKIDKEVLKKHFCRADEKVELV